MTAPPYLIAEIGCNHCGDFPHAEELIRVAAEFCKVPCVKFQKRAPREVLTPDEYDAPHPNPRNSYGDTYGEHREALEFTLDQHRELKALCDALGVDYSCSVWDLTSAREIASLQPKLIKIPSACNTWFELAEVLCAEYGGEIHVSTGMTAPEEIDAIVAFYERRQRAGDLVLYHCTSGYPVPFDDVNLLEIPRLCERYGDRVRGIGFSGHHLGISVDIAGFALGAGYIERHFTLDRTQKGTDHAASLEPDGLRRLWRDMQATQRALKTKAKDVLDIEEPQRAKLKWDRNA
ncbi:MAG: N-acetylneuraminate synthase [Candidatus Hydrogenedens sp.]|nr:N-acetylneuraminate synthase [Candidatus Hydrogenedens sp.]